MELAKPGLIKTHCLPNAIFTFAEYLHDFADLKLQNKGFALIEKTARALPAALQKTVCEKLAEIKTGQRDVYV
jgi:2-iminoacetate synthase